MYIYIYNYTPDPIYNYVHIPLYLKHREHTPVNLSFYTFFKFSSAEKIELVFKDFL